MTVEFTGVWKICSVNDILNVKFVNQQSLKYNNYCKFKQFDNPLEQGITIYDSIDIKGINIDRDLFRIKYFIEKTISDNFDDYFVVFYIVLIMVYVL